MRKKPLASSILLSSLLSCALGFGRSATANAQPRVCTDLGESFAMGVSSFGDADGWVQMAEENGADFKVTYAYILYRANEFYINLKLGVANDVDATPMMTFYQILHFGQNLGGYTGSEARVVQQAFQDPKVMRAYFDNFVFLLNTVADNERPAWIQVEPDTWGFLIWTLTPSPNSDPSSIPVEVAGSGHPDLAGFADNAAGLGQAFVHLRDLYAPNVRLGWHASNFRRGGQPEVMTDFYSQLGEWDFITTEHPHNEANDATWWQPWDNDALDANIGFFSAITETTGLPLVLWQLPIGTTDFHLLGTNGTDRATLQRYAEAGVAGILYEHIGYNFDTEGNADTFRAGEDPLATVPPSETGAGGTARQMRERVAAYTEAPLRWPAGSICARTGGGDVDAGGPVDGGSNRRDAGPTTPGRDAESGDDGGGTGSGRGSGCSINAQRSSSGWPIALVLLGTCIGACAGRSRRPR